MTIKQDIQDFYHTKNWYKNSFDAIVDIYGSDNGRLFAACLAATSPRQSVKSNWKLAKKAFSTIINYETLSGFMGAHAKNLESIQKAWVLSDHRILDDFHLSGRKVDSFYQNLIGNWAAVTVDVWMLRYFGFDDSKGPNKSTYDNIEKRIQKIARSYNLFPAEVQAILWSAVRSHNGHKPATFLIASMDDYQMQFAFMK